MILTINTVHIYSDVSPTEFIWAYFQGSVYRVVLLGGSLVCLQWTWRSLWLKSQGESSHSLCVCKHQHMHAKEALKTSLLCIQLAVLMNTNLWLFAGVSYCEWTRHKHFFADPFWHFFFESSANVILTRVLNCAKHCLMSLGVSLRK